MDKTSYAQPVYSSNTTSTATPIATVHVTNAYLAHEPTAPPLTHQSSVFRFQNEGCIILYIYIIIYKLYIISLKIRSWLRDKYIFFVNLLSIIYLYNIYIKIGGAREFLIMNGFPTGLQNAFIGILNKYILITFLYINYIYHQYNSYIDHMIDLFIIK